jgi:malate dehydrogenase (oxaloacetate-decarboxylating)
MVNLNPTSSFSISMHLEVPNRSGMLASVAQSIASVGGNITSLDITEQTRNLSQLDVTVDAASTEHGDEIVAVVKSIPEVRLTRTFDRTMEIGVVRFGWKVSFPSPVSRIWRWLILLVSGVFVWQLPKIQKKSML